MISTSPSYFRFFSCLIVFLAAGYLTANGQAKSLRYERDQKFKHLDLVIDSLMEVYKIPGLALAVNYKERLVYRQAYGYADVEKKEKVNNKSIFRIASISKPITLFAILKLVQDGRLRLDQTVFGDHGLLGNDFGKVPPHSNINQITVKHLLDNESGWVNEPDDPMFQDIRLSQAALIKQITETRPLKYEPGTQYYYSNFGYCVLGRVIEKVTGQSYERYVKQAILKPADIRTMKIGGNTLKEQVKNEVTYYQQEFSPYQMNVRRMDAHGGWLASATDLMKLMAYVDRNPLKPDIIKPGLLNLFYTGFESWAFYGSLPGTSAILNRVNDEISFSLLVNTRTEKDGNIILNALNEGVKKALLEQKIWTE
jgi:CubicO group peptidase (beta-lactamase class C family)